MLVYRLRAVNSRVAAVEEEEAAVVEVVAEAEEVGPAAEVAVVEAAASASWRLPSVSCYQAGGSSFTLYSC